MPALKKNDSGTAVVKLQRLLISRGYLAKTTGVFDTLTDQAVRAFQASNTDQRGEPLIVDGKAGPLTLWRLAHSGSEFLPTVYDYKNLPSADEGGSALGRKALAVAISELKLGAKEIGGNNRGKWVRKYLAPAGLDEGNAWCAAFLSWCMLQACGNDKEAMPVSYDASAKSLLSQFKKLGSANAPQSGYIPVPGDLVFWWRVKADGWQGHAGFVHNVQDGILYTIEGNRTSKVDGFSYVLSRMDKLLGFVHLED
jgi:hypothetical protein